MSPDGEMRSRTQATDELGQDPELSAAFEVLDPALGDPRYWTRFRTRVLRRAAPELARRRLVSYVSVGDVVLSWARAVVPAAVLAAALAGVVLLKDRTPVPQPSTESIAELLAPGVNSPTIPAELQRTQVAFASSESF